MKIKILKIYSLILLLATACNNDEFLDTQPLDELSNETFWNSEEDAIMGVNDVYRYLNDSWYRPFISGATDDSYAWSTWPADVLYVGNGSATTATGFFSHFWAQNYDMIGAANNVLDNIDRVEDISEATLNRLKGESMTLRAYAYQQLIGMYGDVPLITEIQGVDEFNIARTPRSEVAAFIVAQLEEAAGYLPASYGDSDRGRMTRGAALAIQARTLLYEGEWEAAAEAAQEVMNLGAYGIDDDFVSLFDGTNKGSNEIIMSGQYLESNARNALGTWIGGPSLGGWSQVTPLQSLVDTYEMTDGQTIAESSLYDPENPFANRDPRLEMTVILPGSVVNGVTINITNSESIDRLGQNNASYTGYYFRKYIGADLSGSYDQRSYNDEVLLRYAEVLLTYAEARIEANQIDQSVYDAINQVRQRSGVEMPAVTAATAPSQQDLRELVRRERRVEFALEEHRLFDIRRWGIAEDVMPGRVYGIMNDFNADRGDFGEHVLVESRQFDPSKDYLWPIPQNEMDLNDQLVQNPNW